MISYFTVHINFPNFGQQCFHLLQAINESIFHVFCGSLFAAMYKQFVSIMIAAPILFFVINSMSVEPCYDPNVFTR